MPKKGETKYNIGNKYILKGGYSVEIVEYIDSKNLIIRFECGYTVKVQPNQLNKGTVKYPYRPTVCKIGFIGLGKYSHKSYPHIYETWRSMLKRCYDLKTLSYLPTYNKITTDERWYNFQNFARWFEENYNPETMQGFELDKDILVKGNKVYSPETCCFVPQEINKLFTKRQNDRGNFPIGVYLHKKYNKYYVNSINKFFNTSEEAFEAYKVDKESKIKNLAERYKNKITDVCYKALLNYKVEITD